MDHTQPDDVLELTRTGYDSLIDRAHEGDPEEVCGVLVGRMEGNRTRIEGVIPTNNVADHPQTTYRIDPEEMFAVVEEVEEQGQSVVGFYHSHPDGPRGPSQTDIARATWTDHVYLLVSLDGATPFLGAWVWDGESFVDEPVRVA